MKIISYFILNCLIFILIRSNKVNAKKSNKKPAVVEKKITEKNKISSHNKHKNHGKSKRYDMNENLNAMLLSDASMGFQTAIESDFEELSNPLKNEIAKKGDVHYKTEKLPSSENSYSFSNAQHDKSTQYEPNNNTREIVKSPYEILSETALQYSDYIVDEMRLLAGNKKDDKNCSSLDISECQERGISAEAEQTIIKINPNVENIIKNDQNNENSNNEGQKLDNKKPSGEAPISNENDKNKICNDWSDWGPCSETCGHGFSNRYRDCYENNVKLPQHETKECANPDCLYCTEWSKFSPCNKICGVGVKTRQRTCYQKDGSSYNEKNEENCNFHPCKTECDEWSEWTPCSKPCDTGVSVRNRNCTMPDGSSNTFYEHHSCNTQKCDDTVGSSRLMQSESSPKEGDFVADEDGCITSHIGFEKFQFNVQTIFDDTDEHNDVEYNNIILFNGNNSCEYSGVFNGKKSYMKHYDDIFRNFEKSNLGVSLWLHPIPIPLTQSKNQTIFSFFSKNHYFGKYNLILNGNRELVFSAEIKDTTYVARTFATINNTEWTHIAVSFAGSGDKMEIFINGRRARLYKETLNGQSQNNLLESLDERSSVYQVYGNDNDLTSTFSGIMDEVYVFKCPFTKSDVLTLANMCPFREINQCPSPIHGLCQEPPRISKINENVRSTPQTELQTPLNSQNFD